MALDRFTLFGLGLALVGWVVLLGNTFLASGAGLGGSLAETAVLRADIVSLADAAILSGFVLAILGTLRSGFGALHRFFEAVLQRADTPASSDAEALEPEVMPLPVVEMPSARKPASSGSTRAHNYTILANGAVEVETLLGTRVFASLDEARDYIR